MVDVREALRVTRAPGIPIGTDMEKGTYYVDRAGTVRLLSPNLTEKDVLVASSIAEFATFAVSHDAQDDE